MKHELYILVLLVVVIIIVYLMMVGYARSHGRTFHEDLMGTMYGYIFPEEEFNCNDPTYNQQVEQGRNLACNEVLYIGGLAYNLEEKQVKLLEQRINYTTQGWKQVKIFIYGLDSKEPYKQYLLDWSYRDKRLTLIPALNQSWKDVNVFVKMAKLRNQLHQFVIEHLGPEPSFFLSLDADIGGPISKEGLYHARYLLQDRKIGVVYANGVVSDSFINTIPGLKGWCFPGLGYSYYDDLALILHHDDEAKIYKWFNMAYGRGKEPVYVKSAYGGAGLFRSDALRSTSYDEQTTRCEHHNFNRRLLGNGYDIIVDPSFLLLAGCQGHHLTRKVE